MRAYMTRKSLRTPQLISWRVSARDLALAPLLLWPFLPAVVSIAGAVYACLGQRLRRTR